MSGVHSRLMPTACSFAHIVANLVDMDASKTPHMTASEQALVRRLHFEQGKTRSDISRLLERSLSSIKLARSLSHFCGHAPGQLYNNYITII